jgi:peptide/nickel transport system ATP-binding protein
MNSDVLQVKDLRVHFHTPAGPVKAVNGVSFSLEKGTRLGLVGESGSGKTTTALAILRLIKPPGMIEGGEVLLDNQDLLKFSPEKMRKVRFDKISLIPQGAMNSLNPVLKIKSQIEDIAQDHGGRSAQNKLSSRIPELLDQVGLKADVANMFPHELSGGMKQRVCIAMAITLRPQVIIADEPTSALDVVVQRQVIQTLGKVQEDLQASVILVGHDMGIMAQFVDDLGIMYAGELIEVGKVGEMYREPLHPYTQLLISCIPSLDAKRQFMGIPGVAPSLLSPPPGCPFHPRCPQVMERCAQQKPSLQEIHPGRWVSCFLYEDKHSG